MIFSYLIEITDYIYTSPKVFPYKPPSNNVYAILMFFIGCVAYGTVF